MKYRLEILFSARNECTTQGKDFLHKFKITIAKKYSCHGKGLLRLLSLVQCSFSDMASQTMLPGPPFASRIGTGELYLVPFPPFCFWFDNGNRRLALHHFYYVTIVVLNDVVRT